jgi:hypothetical protein
MSSVTNACQMGLMMGSNEKFMPKQLVTRGQVATVVSRMLGEIDPMSSEADHFAYLKSEGIMNVSNLSSSITRGDALLVLYRIANGSNTDLCTIDPNLPGCDNGNGNGNGTGTVVKEGDLQVSLNPSSPANMSSIPNNGVSRFATVDFTAGAKDVTLNSVSLKRAGLGTYSDFGNGGRLYFEANGVRVSSRATVSSDDTTVLSFSPALVVAAGKTVSIDLMAELVSAPTGTENEFMSTAIESSAATVNGSIDTPILRTAAYSVRSVSFTNQNVLTTYQGNEETIELGKFQLQNNGTNTINVKLQAITLRNVGNGDAAKGLSDLKLLRAGNAVSSNVIVSGRDVTFVLADTITDGQTASYTIQGKVAQVENSAGDTYKFILRQTTDLNAKEANTGFRTAVLIAANVPNDTTTANQYTVNGGELRFTRDTTLSLSQNVTPGATQVEFMKGSITAKQAILLEDVILGVTAGSANISNAFKKVYMQIGNSTFTWTPNASAANPTATFDGSVTVNGTVPVRIYADVFTNASVGGPYTFAPLTAGSFQRREYVSNQNNVNASSAIGSISSSALTVVNSTLSVSKSDGLGTIVYSTNNAQNKMFYGVRLSNSQVNAVKVGSITLTPSNAAMNNGVSVTLKNGSTSIATRTLNGATTFNGLNIVVNKDAPVDLMFEGNFLSTIAGGTNGTFTVSFNPGDVIDNVTSNNVTVTGTPATSAQLSIISGGSVIATANPSTTAQGFAVPGEEKKIGSVNFQAVNDELEVRGLYLKVNGVSAFAAQAGNQISQLKIKDSAGNVVATEASRDSTVAGYNDIVKFTSFNNAKIAVGTSKSYDVFATVNTVNDVNSAGELSVAIATTYVDSSYSASEQYNGTRLYSVNAGTYVNASSVSAASIGNVLNIVASYPKVSKVADGNATDLITVKITNPGSTNLTINALQYFANAQTSADIAQPFKIFNGSTEVAAGTITAAANTNINLNTPITLAGGDSVTLLVKLDSPFVNTSTTPVAGNRVFQISNVNYTQTFANGTPGTAGLVGAGYTNTVGLPVAATNY